MEVNKAKIGKVKDDTWEIGSVGLITQIGGTGFYLSLSDTRFGFAGMLRRGDKVALVNTDGFCNHVDKESLHIKVMVVECQSKKFNDDVGYVKLDSTSFWTQFLSR